MSKLLSKKVLSGLSAEIETQHRDSLIVGKSEKVLFQVQLPEVRGLNLDEGSLDIFV